MRLIIALIISVTALIFDFSFFSKDALFDGRTVGIALFINAFAFIIAALLIAGFIKKQKARIHNTPFSNDAQVKQIKNKGNKMCLSDTSCSHKKLYSREDKKKKIKSLFSLIKMCDETKSAQYDNDNIKARNEMNPDVKKNVLPQKAEIICLPTVSKRKDKFEE